MGAKKSKPEADVKVIANLVLRLMSSGLETRIIFATERKARNKPGSFFPFFHFFLLSSPE